MENDAILASLYDHQRRANDLLQRGTEVLGTDTGDLQHEIGAVLQEYQIFKHEQIFNPAVTSAAPDRAKLAREMKIECIAAGEAFRTHVHRWTADAIAADVSGYRASTRLTFNSVRRHIDREREGITALLLLADDDGGRS